MHLLITGGAGFIGSNLAIRLIRNRPQDRFTILDKLTYCGNLENLQAIEGLPNWSFVRGSISDARLVRELMSEVEAVINLAAESHVDRSIESPDVFIQTNVVGVQILLDAALDKGLKKFIQVSTDEVYGSLGPEDPPFHESTPLAPNSPYAASKAGADLLVRSYVKTYDLPGIITRCSNNYGPLQFPEKLIPLVLTNALEGRELPIYGDGRNIRDWIHVQDHCAGLEAALDHGRPGRVYNFGGGCQMSNLALVDLLLDLLAELTDRPAGKLKKLKRFVQDRPGHDRRYAMSFDLASEELNWRPTMNIQCGLAETIKWYLENEAWWRAIKKGAYLDYYERHYLKRMAWAAREGRRANLDRRGKRALGAGSG